MQHTEATSKYAFRESLKLDQKTEVPDSIVQYLTSHQLEGIRFIHQALKHNKGVILNDESGLGKIHQAIGYLSAVTTDHADKSIVVCSGLNRVHHWMYHLEMLTKFHVGILSVDENALEKHQIVLVTFDDLEKHLDCLMSDQRQYLVVIIDETKAVPTKYSQIVGISELPTSKKIFLFSHDLLDDLSCLTARLKLCANRNVKDAVDMFLDETLTASRCLLKSERIKLFFLTRSILLRRFRCHYKHYLPLMDKAEFGANFASWKIASGLDVQCQLDDMQPSLVVTKSDSNQLFQFDEDLSVQQDCRLNEAIVGDVTRSTTDDVRQEEDDEVNAVALNPTDSEPLFDLEEHSTDEMPKLEVSDSETKSTIEDTRISPGHESTANVPQQPANENIEIPETERSSQATENQTDSEGFLEFGQALACGQSEGDQPVTEEKYCYSISRLFRVLSPSSSSTDVEIVSKENGDLNPIVISSASTNEAAREKSPDLFSDSDEEADETVKNNSQDSLMDLLLKSPACFEQPAEPAAMPKFAKSNSSTPISKLLHATMHAEREDPTIDDSTNDIFADETTVTERKGSPNRTDNVFEITDNNAFGNIVRFDPERDCMSPLKCCSQEIQFVGEYRINDDPIEIIDSQPEMRTPKSATKKVVTKKTPSSSGSTTTPQGWLSRSSRNSSSPRTPTREASRLSSTTKSGGSSERTTGFKRKKLENWFKDDGDCGQASTSNVHWRRSAPSGASARKTSPRKKCFQERIAQRYTRILVSPSGFDSDFE
ncbi:uncharacterized protein LOC131437363 [Malaya genurostris]|uniref:uncharacterized protein LOC131437363 n=1 Tax=Malaya genurostris TaxID=325434 RepID=UPI0026F3FA4D|nr:uncharacterized protein LOC131437363 [Malaya genurostris]